LRLELRKPAVREVSRYQPVRRDFSLLLPERTQWAQVDAALGATELAELVDWRVREVMRGGTAEAGTYSLLLGVTFQAADRTLREEELQAYSARVVEAVSTVGGRLRG
jgi:phenylalanyl-tRNA synthetase beta chain